MNDFTEAELQTWTYRDTYFVQLLNGEISLETAREDLASFRNGEYYTGDNPKYMQSNPAHKPTLTKESNDERA